MTAAVDRTQWYRLPVMWIVVALPLISLVGGVVMVALTFTNPDTEVHSERISTPAPVTTPAG